MSEQEFPQSPTGCWIITRLFSKTGAPIDVKSSGTNTKAAIDDLYSGITYGIEHYGWQPEAPKAPPAPAPKPDAAAEIAAEEGNLELAAEIKAGTEAIPESPKGKTWQTFDAVFVRYLPQPDGKCTIEFYGNQHKQPHDDYAGVKVNKWPWEGVQGLMKHVTSHDPAQAGEFSLLCRVFFVDGKEYTTPSGVKGHYKDVCHVRLI